MSDESFLYLWTTFKTIDFTGVQNGRIHPSDIDAVLEFDNEALILIEVKRENNDIPTGQRLLLERICNSWRTDKSISIKASLSNSKTASISDGCILPF